MGGGRGAKVRVWLKESFVEQLEAVRNVATEILEDSDISVVADGTPPRQESRMPAPTELSDEELDRVADTAAGTIEVLLKSFNIEGEVEEYEGDEGEIILDIVGKDLAVLIGRHGRTLDSIQVLTSAITNKQLGYRYPVLVDIEGYRNRRKSKLEEIGLRAASRAARQGTPVQLRPMSALERRVIHMVLRDDRMVRTASEGEDPYRAVVVYPNKN